MLTFYYATNTCALASHIALEEAGAAYETRWIDFGAAEQTKPNSRPSVARGPKRRTPSPRACGFLTESGLNEAASAA
jgi:glutathione S-transferase